MKFTFGIFAIIIGVALFTQFDFENLKFENTGLAIVYLIGFLISIYLIIKDFKKRPEK